MAVSEDSEEEWIKKVGQSLLRVTQAQALDDASRPPEPMVAQPPPPLPLPPPPAGRALLHSGTPGSRGSRCVEAAMAAPPTGGVEPPAEALGHGAVLTEGDNGMFEVNMVLLCDYVPKKGLGGGADGHAQASICQLGPGVFVHKEFDGFVYK